MPRHTEPTANSVLGGFLDRMLPSYEVRSENTQQIVGRPGLQPDILITAPGRAPMVIEAEFMPAYTAEEEAEDRLGLEVVGTARHIDAAIALRYPDGLEDASDLSAAISDARLSYCVCYQDETRFPESGWLEGPVEDLSDLVRLVSVPQRAVDEAADVLEKGIDRAAAILGQLAESRPDVVTSVAGLLGMSEVLQTYRMAGAIVANAMVFHERLAGLHGVKPLSQLCSTSIANPKENILDAWTEILKINYWPIFAIARDIVEQIPAAEAAQLLSNLRTTVEDVAATGANQTHDLTGRIFQRLIADRKYLATFYTLPASAALLSAVYEQIATRHESSGGDLAALHPVMMEEVLYGCDVMPSAIHITSSTLSGAQPNVGFGKTRLYTLAYGRQEDGTVRIGSLDLLQSSSAMSLFNVTNPALRTGSAGQETATQVIADVPDERFDLVIMNPPFTRATNHEGAHADVTFDDKRMDFAFSVWTNSTLGLMCHWWHSSRQQSSKAGMTIRSAESLPVLDLRTLTDDQLSTAESIFDDFRDRDLMPAFLADIDPNRALLDRCVVRDLLGFNKSTYQAVRLLAAKWCAEPSVHGGKKRPKSAGLVI